MKKIKSLVYTALMTLTLSLSSCADWLTLLPLNDVVLENYWTEKADVESVLLGAYAQLESSACIERMSIWGETVFRTGTYSVDMGAQHKSRP